MCMCVKERVCKKDSSNILLDKVKYWDPSQTVNLRKGEKKVVAKDNKGEWNMKTCPTFPIRFLSPVTAARGQASVLVELQGPSKISH